MSLAASPVPPSGTALFDARRGVHYAKPALRGWLHLVWFEAALVLGTLLLAATHGAAATAAVAVYVGSVAGLFGVSATYHRGNWSPTWNRLLQRADTTMIFLMIAGTATPAFVVAAPQPFGTVCLVLIWSLTAVAVTVRMLWMHAPERLVGGTFLALGAVAGLALPAVWTSAGVAAGVLMAAGGLLYVLGALAYHARRPDPLPAVFGYHEVFHAFVCAAASCQFVAVALVVL